MNENSYARNVKIPDDASFFLFGPRQVGKSTLIRELFPPKEKSLLFDLLDREQLRKLQRNLRSFREEIIARDHKKITHVIVDEIQKLPDLLNEVHFIMENINQAPFFILTGSSARKLKKSGVNMLGGRALSFSLSSFNHLEIEQDEHYRGLNFPLNKILERGTLPKVFLEHDKDRANMMLRAYVETYLEEEIKLEALVRNLDAFTGFLELAAMENGEIMNFSNLARDLGVSHTTIKEYYQILEDTLMGFFLRPFYRSTRKKLVRSPKFYFFDVGVQRAVAGKLRQDLEIGTKPYGRVFEHYIIKEIINLSKYNHNDFKFSFYRTDSGAEVDLIIETPNDKIYAIEIKSTDDPQQKYLNGLRSFQEVCPNAQLICACQTQHRSKMDDISIIPWQELFEVIGLA